MRLLLLSELCPGGLTLSNRIMMANLKFAYVDRFACGWLRFSITDAEPRVWLDYTVKPLGAQSGIMVTLRENLRPESADGVTAERCIGAAHCASRPRGGPARMQQCGQDRRGHNQFSARSPITGPAARGATGHGALSGVGPAAGRPPWQVAAPGKPEVPAVRYPNSRLCDGRSRARPRRHHSARCARGDSFRVHSAAGRRLQLSLRDRPGSVHRRAVVPLAPPR